MWIYVENVKSRAKKIVIRKVQRVYLRDPEINVIKILKFTRNSYNLSPIQLRMQENLNSSSLLNGDNRSPDRFANIRAAEERKLLARNNGHGSKKIIMEQMTNIPIPEDDNEEADKHSGRESGGTASTPDAENTDSVLLKNEKESRQSHPKRALESVYTHFEISKKSRIPFLVLSVACFILLLIVIILAIVWPYIPSYMRDDVCIEEQCFDASKQVSLAFNGSFRKYPKEKCPT